jgi:predicted patatin/cPLA2 family phospholipase
VRALAGKVAAYEISDAEAQHPAVQRRRTMITCLRAIALLTIAASLGACAGKRPAEASCPAATGAVDESFDAALDDAVAARWTVQPGMTHSRAAVLVLSGGGAWGAYGAGFLDGWAKRPQASGDNWPSRPTFDVVTGVSTGAIMAPFALLGSSNDPKLQSAFRGVSRDDLFTSRSFITLPWWNSLKDPKGLERQLRDALDNSAVVSLKAAASQHRTMWVGAVNFDTGKFTQFNLSALARDLPVVEARDQIIDHIMAASAVPTFFPPRFINGCMYMDGGVREDVFVTRLHDAIGTPTGTKESHADVYVIENGPIRVQKLLTDNTLVDIAIRGFSLAEAQIQLASLRNVYDYAKERGYGFYWTSADDVVGDLQDTHDRPGLCKFPKTPTDQFEATFTTCLYDSALRKARDGASPWRTDRP